LLLAVEPQMSSETVSDTRNWMESSTKVLQINQRTSEASAAAPLDMRLHRSSLISLCRPSTAAPNHLAEALRYRGNREMDQPDVTSLNDSAGRRSRLAGELLKPPSAHQHGPGQIEVAIASAGSGVGTDHW